MAGGEQWKFDARMGGGSLSLLAAYVTDIISHILGEQASRAQGTLDQLHMYIFILYFYVFIFAKIMPKFFLTDFIFVLIWIKLFSAFSLRSAELSSCDSFTAFHLAFPSSACASATVALADYFEVRKYIFSKNIKF